MKRLITEYKVWKFIEAAIIITIGVLAIVSAINGETSFVGLISGIALIVDGTLRASINIIVKENKSFTRYAISIGELSIGIWLCIDPSQLAESLTLISSLTILVTWTFLLVEAITDSIRKTKDVKSNVMQYIVSILTIAIGVVALVFFPFNGSTSGLNTITFILILLGSALCVFGIYEIVTTIIVIVKAKKAEKTIIEATAKKHEEKRVEEKQSEK